MIDAVMYGMIPSANRAIRPRPPPEKVFSRPRMFDPPKFSCTSWTAWTSMPGTGTCDPSRYRARIMAVNASFLRISATVNALRTVESIRADPTAR